MGVACSRIYWRSCSSALLPIKHYHGYLKLFREGARPGFRREGRRGAGVAVPTSAFLLRKTMCVFEPDVQSSDIM